MYNNENDAREAVVSRSQAIAEVLRHHCDHLEFLSECGDKDEYLGSEVLNWLGY